MDSTQTSEPHSPTLRAAIDRVIPADDFPSASEAGVDHFILNLFRTDRKSDAAMFETGLRALDAEAASIDGKTFADASPQQQDEILERAERGENRTVWPIKSPAFFALLLNVTAEGYFSDPGNGGNRDMVSWKMVGYDPGANRP